MLGHDDQHLVGGHHTGCRMGMDYFRRAEILTALLDESDRLIASAFKMCARVIQIGEPSLRTSNLRGFHFSTAVWNHSQEGFFAIRRVIQFLPPRGGDQLEHSLFGYREMFHRVQHRPSTFPGVKTTLIVGHACKASDKPLLTLAQQSD